MAKCKCRQWSMMSRTIFVVKYCKDWEKKRGIQEWIMSEHQKCVHSMVILFPTQTLEKIKMSLFKWLLFGLVSGL